MTLEELQTKYPDKSFGVINVHRTYDCPLSGKIDRWGNKEKDHTETAQIIDKGWEYYLDHSCDEWIIGSTESAISFLENLKDALEYTKLFKNI